MLENEIITDVNIESGSSNSITPVSSSSIMATAGGGLPDLETVARRAKYIKEVFAHACNGLSTKNIIDFGGQPYLDHLACKKIASLFNLQVQQFYTNAGVAYKKEVIDEATNHYTIRIAGKVFFANNPNDFEVYEGSSSSFDDWFKQWQIVEEREVNGKKKKVVVSAQTLPQTKVEEKATANLLQKAVKKKLGLDFTWEELEHAGIERSKCRGFSFSGAGEADSAELTDKKKAIWAKIVEICNGDVELAKKTLKKHTSFTKQDGSTFEGYDDINKVKEKPLEFLAQKVEKAYKEHLKAMEGGSENGDN